MDLTSPKDVLLDTYHVFFEKNTGGKNEKDILLDTFPFRSCQPTDIHAFSVFCSAYL